MNLAELPIDHKLRNTPLVEIGAEYQKVGLPNSPWMSVDNSYGIAKCTYNKLSNVWTDYEMFRATKF